MSIKSWFRRQWTNLTGMIASVGSFLYNFFNPTKFTFFAQSGIGDTVQGIPLSISLGVISIVVFVAFAAGYVYTHKQSKGRR